MNRMAEEGRPITFDGVTNELKYPADHEEPQSPPPTEENERQCDQDQRNANRV
jgi:hypothetical protein